MESLESEHGLRSMYRQDPIDEKRYVSAPVMLNALQIRNSEQDHKIWILHFTHRIFLCSG